MSDNPASLGITEIRDLLTTYIDGDLEEEQLVDRLAQICDLVSDEPTDTLAAELTELVARIEMIHLNICRAEQRHAMVEVLAEFKKHHLESAR